MRSRSILSTHSWGRWAFDLSFNLGAVEKGHATLDEVLSDSRSSTHCHEWSEIRQGLSGVRAVYI